jgi:hypothetical protein
MGLPQRSTKSTEKILRAFALSCFRDTTAMRFERVLLE